SSSISIPQKCASLKNSLNLENTTIIASTHIPAGSNISTPGVCQSSATVTSAVCRVQAFVNTTTSSVHFEAWLPDEWFGKFLGLENGGLGGCVDYTNLDYGTTMHFASIRTDNGHDGNSSVLQAIVCRFFHNPEVLNDFAFRSIHVEALLGKEIVKAYYSKVQAKSYYLGCSIGGRQAMQTALKFPDDFDGFVAGSPAVDFNNLPGMETVLVRFVGAPDPMNSPSFIPAKLWPVISQEILNQRDLLDEVKDGIITDPSICNFRPEALLCQTQNQTGCITPTQAEVLTMIYRLLFGTQGELLYPGYDPLAKSEGQCDWYRFGVFMNPSFSFETRNFSVKDVEVGDAINLGDIATFDGHFETFKDRGGKIISFHGRQDQLISSGNSPRFYNLISQTLSLPSLHSFYRLFLVPVMQHCTGGPGAWAIGQQGIVSNIVNASSHNVLLALVDWMEKGGVPGEIVGSVPGEGAGGERRHCRYPTRSVWVG
ncbi:hypothetical protein M422DRAFT_115059, partial [Sphaerobolus stellatus SS14]